MSMPDFPPGDTIPGQEDNTGPETGTVESNNPAPSEAEGTGFNPAWNSLLEKLPDEFHNLIKPDLQKWDTNYTKLQEQYKPFEAFNQRNPQDLTNALLLMDNINTEEGARAIYEGLGNALGITAAQAEKLVDEELATDAEFDPEDESPTERELRELRSQVNEIQNTRQQEAQQKLVAGYESELDSYARKMFDNDPTLSTDEVRKKDIFFRANALVNSGVQGDVFAQAYAEQQQYNSYFAQVLQQRSANDPNQNAPLHVSPTASAPGTGIDPSTRTEEQRKQAFIDAMAAAQASG